MIRPPPRSTRTATLFPYTTPFRCGQPGRMADDPGLGPMLEPPAPPGWRIVGVVGPAVAKFDDQGNAGAQHGGGAAVEQPDAGEKQGGKGDDRREADRVDRKSTRLNSSH